MVSVLLLRVGKVFVTVAKISPATRNAVKDVNFYGLANGTARGGVPAARIVVYKVWGPSLGHNVLAAFDDAIADGVNIISISMGNDDPVAIGAFHAMKKGILTSQSAGNMGLKVASVVSVAPWILTVAASSIDRRFTDKVVLANGKTLVVHAGTKNCTGEDAGDCEEGCLDGDSVKGKIVLCDSLAGDRGAYKAGALGSVLMNEVGYNVSLVPLLASTALMREEYNVVRSYTNSTRDPQANIFKSEVIKDPAAPTVAYFSSRGPIIILPDIIKPDISAPGVEILAAYSPVVSVTRLPQDKRHVKYNILSGTSMACPHAAGAAAYVKVFHPNWSPAAIKSSLMTTAWPMNGTSNNVSTGAFAYGSGHINPVNAINPGLVYEASEEDYIKLLCTIYDEGKVRLISGDNSTCPTGSAQGYVKDHNHPSMGAKVKPMKPFSVNFHRRVKNVGLANSTYKATIFSNSNADIKVVPEVLSFQSLDEEKDFEVTVAGSDLPDGAQVSGSLVWSDGAHRVRSPIVVYTYIQQEHQNMVT
ncbi:subtilisin-like protease SBT4.4 [Prunus yedoensis var. nudiflora]|uniref:Subtilisin-like protease SBT4.4 n=1 Tax=Prunus yedoensis var. nudiflora TaxID=2094558 RepID=A0A314UPK3_PRUYE|nr:subtilisin-like protease SBT4.4 [Prunus yedoensis var. nudiflora]